MKDKDKQRRSLQPLCAFLLALVMVLTHVMGAMEVYAEGEIPAPTIDKVFYDATTISGGNVHRGRIGGKTARGTIYVTLKGKDGTVKATVSVTPKSTKWTVDLPEGKKVAEGDTVTAYQEFDGSNSESVTANAEPGKNYTNKDKLTMPTGEIWIEQTSSNQINDDEQAEAVQMFNNANTAIAGDIKSVKFSIDGTNHAYYEVTYNDDSTSGKIEAPNLKINQVTETSRSPKIDSITVVDNVVKGKLEGEGPFDGIKVQLILNVKKEKSGDFCTDKGCKIDKDSSKPIVVPVESDGSFSYTLQSNDKLELDQIVGVSVKEPHKFKSCSTTTVKPATVGKTKVKDPRKLTPEDKKAIDAAIRKAYTVNGVSKLPDANPGTDWQGLPAVIQIDDSGNVKIFDASDAVVNNWDDDGNAIPEKNPDGSIKLNSGAKPKITIQGKDLLKNIKPDAPTLALSKDKKNITITPNLEVDTDAKIITVSYKDKDNKDQTTTATKADDGTWSITKGEGSVDQNGVVSLPKNKVKGETVVSATVTDKGGIADDDTTPLTSDPGTLKVEETKADKVEALGGLDPVDIKKWVGDTVDWKDGVKAKDSTKETEVNKLLAGATFTDVTEEKRNTSKEGDFTGKVKVKFDDGSEIIVEKQMLYVSNYVTSVERKDKVPTDALDVEFKLGEGTKVDNTGSGAIEGNKKTPTSYAKYKVKPNTNLKTYVVPVLNSNVVDSIKLTEQDGYTDPTWNTNNFVATTTNNVFTAKATKTFKVTVQANGGTGDDKVETKKSGEKYTLPKGDTFTPPENKEFAGWLVGDATTTTTDPGTEITITGDTVIKASWKPIELKVNFLPGTDASGEMKDVPVNKGSDYTLPEPTFTPPTNQEFAGWKVSNEDGVKKAGETIKITDNVTLTATWKDIEYKVTFNGNEGTGSMDPATVKKGEKYKLPDNSFGTPPNKQGFKTWLVDGKEVAPGTEITIEKDTEVKAIWKGIEYKVTFNGTEGTGTMPGKLVKKGEEYTLPDNGFEAPKDKVFDGWMIGTEKKSVGDKVKIESDMEIKAIWKDKTSEETPTTPEEPTSDPIVDVKEDGSVTVTPKDKDTTSVTVEYKDPTGQGKKITVTKGEDGKFKGPEGIQVNPDNGEITIPNNQLKPRTTKDDIKARAYKKAKKPGKSSPAPAITWKGYWYLGANPVQVETTKKSPEMEIGRHYKYLYGYVDKTVRPEGMITRSEAAALIARLAELDMTDKTKPNFKDTPSAWYNSAINIMVKKDLMFGDKNGNFRPNEPITRGEFARALYYIDKKNDKVAPFADVKGHEFEDAINQAYGNDRIAGYPDGSFKPNAYIQRAEAARILNQYADRSASLEGMANVKNDLVRFTDINESHWAYCEVMEAANSHEYQRAKGTLPETWLKILDK